MRSGPGFQYPVVNQISANVPVEITGCVSDYSWCSVALPGGATGWASAPYLVTKAAGQPKNMSVVGAQLGIPVVVPANTGRTLSPRPRVGAMVPVAPTVGVVAPIVPPPNVVTFVTQQTVTPVIVNGEVMIGAALPAAAPTYDIPASDYDFAYINGQRVLVEPTRGRSSTSSGRCSDHTRCERAGRFATALRRVRFLSPCYHRSHA